MDIVDKDRLHVLVINIGSPKSFDEADVARFIRSMLMDRHLLTMPKLFRAFLVNAIIIPRRKARISKLYQNIWQSGKSAPITEATRSLVSKIESKLQEKESSATISFAMRYGEDDSIEKEIGRVAKRGVKRLLVIPLYPQYTSSTYQSCVDEVIRVTHKYGIKERCFTPPFYSHGDYISALERSFREALNGITVDRLLLSFHSIPLHHNAAEYRQQCEQTARMLCERLGIDAHEYSVVYQSNTSPKGWLSPTLFSTLESLPAQGVESVAVIAPSFTADCLETLSEIDVEGREIFLAHGGREFHYIPALNDSDLWVKKLTKWVVEFNG